MCIVPQFMSHHDPEDKSFGPCLACGSPRVRRSRRRGVKERVMKLFSKHIRFFRCHKCVARYMIDSKAGATKRLK